MGCRSKRYPQYPPDRQAYLENQSVRCGFSIDPRMSRSGAAKIFMRAVKPRLPTRMPVSAFAAGDLVRDARLAVYLGHLLGAIEGSQSCRILAQILQNIGARE